jgi:hypothetical protein
LTEVTTLAEIPLPPATLEPEAPEPGSEHLATLALVPYRQVRERGFKAIDDQTPLTCLIADHRGIHPLEEVLAVLPDQVPDVVRGTFAYQTRLPELVREVPLEIGRAGSNFDPPDLLRPRSATRTRPGRLRPAAPPGIRGILDILRLHRGTDLRRSDPGTPRER